MLHQPVSVCAYAERSCNTDYGRDLRWAGGGASMDAGKLHVTAQDPGGTDLERVRDDSFELAG